MNKYKLGVIGGMGPLATSVFFNKIIERTHATNDQDHIDMVILNHASIPDRTTAIINNDKEDFLTSIKNDINLLELSEVKNIAIPCNTSHYFYEDIQKMTNINVINMISSTVNTIAQDYEENSKVAVLGTNGTVYSKVYDKELEQHQFKVHSLSNNLQNEIMKIIYKIKSDSTYHPANFPDIIHKLIYQEGCTCVILACTELSSIELEADIKQYCVDALDVLIQESIKLSGRKLK